MHSLHLLLLLLAVPAASHSVLGSSLTGAFSEVFVNTGAATGTVALDSVTPMNVSVNLGGITTLLVDGPPGVCLWCVFVSGQNAR